jgi:hypothetical protein
VVPRSRAFEPSPIAIVGGVLAIISCFLAWDDVAGLAWNDSFKVPFEFLWDKDASGGVKLGIPLVIVAAVVALLSLSPILPVDLLRRLGGVLLLAACALFVVQLGRRLGWDNLNDNLGIGPYLAGAGGLLALLAPPGLWPFVQRRLAEPASPAPSIAGPPPPGVAPAPPPPPPEQVEHVTPAGWYPDPEGEGQRYWDGTRWTEHTAP